MMYTLKPIYLLSLISTLMLPALSHAAAITQLKSFISSTQSLSADFDQEVHSGSKVQKVSGTLEILRPGKFRWSYTKPYEQLIVGDGSKLWIFDQDLMQVTVRNLGSALGSSPAALLAGNNAIEKDYTLKEDGKTGNVEWLSASPKQEQNTFSAIRMGFTQNTLSEMRLVDSFGNTTQITFKNLKKNPKINKAAFIFTPPKGVDVLTE